MKLHLPIKLRKALLAAFAATMFLPASVEGAPSRRSLNEIIQHHSDSLETDSTTVTGHLGVVGGGSLTIGAQGTIDGAGSYGGMLLEKGWNQNKTLTIKGTQEGAPLVFTGFTGGSRGAYGGGSGGVIAASGDVKGQLIIENVSFENNEATIKSLHSGDGGALYLDETTGLTVSLTDVSFKRNMAAGVGAPFAPRGKLP